MASNNETVAEIVREMFEYPKSRGDYNHLDWKALAKRIQEAHDHELNVQYGRISRLVDKLAEKDDERLTIVANYETVIAEKDAMIARLRERIKIAEVALGKIDNMCDGDMCKYFEKTHYCSACRYLNECQTGVAHAALAAIREKGANNGK